MDQIRFSIVVPVYHEGDRINGLIEHLDRLDSAKECEIIVVDGAEEKDTLKAIQNGSVIKISSEKGRARQMNAGASIARGEVLTFLHADTELPVHALKMIDTVMEKNGYVGGAFDLGIKSDKPTHKVIAHLASFRSRLNRIPYGDQAIFIWKDYFKQMGGYKEILFMEDVELMRRIKKSGGKIWILPDRVMTSPRRWEKEGLIFCTLRNWILVTLFLLGVSPDKLAKYYKN